MRNLFYAGLMGFYTLLFALPFTVNAQIWPPEGLNMPGDWNGWVNYPASGSIFRSSTHTPAGNLTLISAGDRRWQTAINCQSSGGNVTPNTTYQFLFTSGPSNSPWNNAWRNTTIQMNTLQNYNFTGSGANNSITFGAAGVYTMNWRDIGYVNTNAIFMYTANAPVTLSGWSQSPVSGAVGANQAVTVNMTFSAAPSPQELFYVRYTTNGFTNSQIAPVTVNGLTGSATIPGQALNANVQYYVFSTVINNPSSNYDMLTLRLLNNGGLNYNYTVGAVVWTSVKSGNWSDPTLWSPGIIPTANATVTIASDHSVTLDTNTSVASLTIQNNATLTTSDGNTRTITLPNNGTVINNGTVSCPAGSVFNLSGRGVFTGNVVTLQDVYTAGELDVPTGSSVAGLLRLNSGGYLTRAVTYLSGTTLQYTADYGRFNEWLTGNSGPGVPWNVIVNSGITLNMNGNTSEAFVRGNLTLNGVIGLSNQSGGNLVIQGNYLAGSSSSLLPNSRSVIFRGTTAQQAGKAGAFGEIFGTLVLDNAAGLSLTSNVQINATLNLLQGQLNNNGQVLTLAAGTNLRRVSGSVNQTPTYTDSVNLEYAGSLSAGVEWPANFNKVRNLSVTGGSVFSATDSRLVNRSIDCSSGTVSIASGATLQLNGTLVGTAVTGQENSTFVIGGSSTAAATLAPAGPLCHVAINRNATISLGGNLTIQGDLLLNSGQLRVSGGRTLSFTGLYGSDSLTRIVFNGGALEGTDQGSGNDLSATVTQGTLRIEGNASNQQNADHKAFAMNVQTNGRLELLTGLLVRYGSFAINGELIMGNGAAIETQPSGSSMPTYNASTGRLRYSALTFNQGVEWPLSSGPVQVRVANAATVQLTQSRTVSVLQINGGGTMNLNAPLLVTNGGSVSGMLNVNSGQSLSVSNAALNLVSGGEVLLQDGASFLDQEAVVGGGGSLNGNLKAKRQGSSSSLKYNFWSSPVAGSTLGVLGSADLRRFDAATQSWFPSTYGINLPTNTPMSFGIGYTASNSGLVQFTGVANNTNTNVNLIQNPGSNDDWNLLGNPYPSAIQGQTFLTDNAGRINGAVYFWDRSFVYGAANAQNNFSGSDYVARNLTSGAFAIPSCQGFFVEAVGAQAQFRNQQRISSAAALYRQQNDVTERAYFTLRNSNRTSACLIGFDAKATNQYDALWDAKKMFGQSELQVYSLLAGVPMDIQGMGELEKPVSVALGVMAKQSGKAQFKLERKENWRNAEVWLEDKKVGKFYQLGHQAVALDLFSGTEESRFVLHFRPQASISTNPTSVQNEVSVWASSGYLIVNTTTQSELLTLIDMNGKKVWEEVRPSESSRVVRSLNLPSGVYLLRVQTANGLSTHKLAW